MSLSNFLLMLKGGAGSGNFGHEGIPGHRGGSAPKSSFQGDFKDRYIESFGNSKSAIKFINALEEIKPSELGEYIGSCSAHKCQTNAKSGPGQLTVGYLINKVDGSAIWHTWNEVNGKVRELTDLGIDQKGWLKEYEYRGIPVPEQDKKNYKWDGYDRKEFFKKAGVKF